jgi:hypothetical protein
VATALIGRALKKGCIWKGQASNLLPSYAFRRTSENAVNAKFAEIVIGEVRRILIPRTSVNKTHSGRIEPPAPTIKTVALDGSAYTLEVIFASIREKDYVFYS